MSNFDRIRYSNALIFAGPTPATGAHFANDGNSGPNLINQLFRVTSYTDSWDDPKEDVLEFGVTNAIDRVTVTSPTPTMSFDYRLTNGINEYFLGLPINGDINVLSGVLDKTQDDKNYFALYSPEGEDAVGSTDRSNHSVKALGNGYITNLTFSATVGDFANGAVDIEGQNFVVNSNSSGNDIPAVNPENGIPITTWQYAIPTGVLSPASVPSVIQQGGVNISLAAVDVPGIDTTTSHIQSFTLTVPVTREPLEKLGNTYAFSRPVNTPINATLSVDANAAGFQTGNLATLINNCDSEKYDITIDLDACVGGAKTDVMKFIMKGAYVDGENSNTDLGGATNGTLNFTIPLGDKTNITQGVFISGSYINTL